MFSQFTTDASDRVDARDAEARALAGVVGVGRALGMDIEPVQPLTKPIPVFGPVEQAAIRRLVQRAALANVDLWEILLSSSVEHVEAMFENSFKAGFDREVTPETSQSHVGKQVQGLWPTAGYDSECPRAGHP